MDANKTISLTVLSALDLTMAASPRNLEDELLERRPRLISVRAVKRLEPLTSAAKPARPFDEELALADATY